MAESVHSGHRQRFKEQFLQTGLDGLSSHQLLEMLLYYSIPRKDTNPLAHRLIDTFGSLSGVLEAEYEELCRVEGVTPHTAIDVYKRQGVGEERQHPAVERRCVSVHKEGVAGGDMH